MKKIIILVLAVALLGAIGYGAYAFMTVNNVGSTGIEAPTGEEGTVEVVATVNGEEIPFATLQEMFIRLGNNVQQLGGDLDDPQLRTSVVSQALQTVVANELVLQASRASGVEADSAEVDSRFAEIVELAGGREEFDSRAAETGLTEASVRASIENDVRAREYLLAATDLGSVTVTDADVQERYDALVENDAEIGSFDEVSNNIRIQLINEREKEIFDNHVLELVDVSDVQILVDPAAL